MEEIVLVPAGRQEFLDWVDASAKTENWMYSYNDYDRYRDMLGDENVRFMAAKTKCIF